MSLEKNFFFKGQPTRMPSGIITPFKSIRPCQHISLPAHFYIPHEINQFGAKNSDIVISINICPISSIHPFQLPHIGKNVSQKCLRGMLIFFYINFPSRTLHGRKNNSSNFFIKIVYLSNSIKKPSSKNVYTDRIIYPVVLQCASLHPASVPVYTHNRIFAVPFPG